VSGQADHNKGKIMRIKIEHTIDIDVEKWCEEYLIDSNQVREDVKEYVRSMIDTQFAHLMKDAN